MFIHLLDKIYAVNKSSAPKPWDPEFLIVEYKDNNIPDFPTTDMFFKYISKEYNNPKRSITLLLIEDDLFCYIIGLYLKMLNLYDDKNYIDLIIHHSNFCIKYMENCHSISDEDKILFTSNNFNIEDNSIGYIKDYSSYPAELAINCLDKEWSRNKFKWFRMHHLYNVIKQYQYDRFRDGIYNNNNILYTFYDDQTGKKLLDDNIYNNVIKELENNNIDISIFKLSIEEYIAKWTNLGYNQYHYFKFNFNLAKYIIETKYRIDKWEE